MLLVRDSYQYFLQFILHFENQNCELKIVLKKKMQNFLFENFLCFDYLKK